MKTGIIVLAHGSKLKSGNEGLFKVVEWKNKRNSCRGCYRGTYVEIFFDDLAGYEYQDAIEFYELKVQGLGLRFKEEVKRALRNLIDFPDMGSIEKGNIRRYILHKFPYKILYSNEGECPKFFCQ